MLRRISGWRAWHPDRGGHHPRRDVPAMRPADPSEQHYAYFDESYSENGTCHFVAGALASESQWDSVEVDLHLYRKDCIARFGLADDVEFHAYLISSGAGEWSPLKGRHRDAAKVLET